MTTSQVKLSTGRAPAYQPQIPLLQRIIFTLLTPVFKFVAETRWRFIRWKHSFPEPDEIKPFPTHSHLRNRVFYPPRRDTKTSPPLYLDIHGGGFITFDPSLDDGVNTHIAKDLNCLVISLDYSKAPAAKFPTPTNELIDTILDILADESLVFDRARVVLGGHSAGGNLTISCAQSPRLQGKLAGAITWYPATDVADDHEPKALLRPYDFPGEVDGLMKSIPAIKYGYLKVGQDLNDPRLSTLLADRKVLPKHIMIVAAENDVLAHEAWRQARRYTNQDDSVDWEGDQESKYGFQKDDVTYLMVRRARHGFTHFGVVKGDEEVKRKKQEDECWREVREWFESGPFGANGR